MNKTNLKISDIKNTINENVDLCEILSENNQENKDFIELLKSEDITMEGLLLIFLAVIDNQNKMLKIFSDKVKNLRNRVLEEPFDNVDEKEISLKELFFYAEAIQKKRKIYNRFY